MKCKCGKELSEYEVKKFGICINCYNKEWSNNHNKAIMRNPELKIQQAKNMIKNFDSLRELGDKDVDYAIRSYEEYIKELEGEIKC